MQKKRGADSPHDCSAIPLRVAARMFSRKTKARSLSFVTALTLALMNLAAAPISALAQDPAQPQSAQRTKPGSSRPMGPQDPPPKKNTDQKASGEEAEGTDNGSPKDDCLKRMDNVNVTDAYNVDDKRRRAGLNEIIVISVENLDCLLAKSKCDSPFKEETGCRPQNIVLFIDGRSMAGLKPESGAPTLEGTATSPKSGSLRYHLRRELDTSESAKNDNEHWADLLGLGSDLLNWRDREVEVSVGLAEEYPVRTAVKPSSTDKSFSLVRVRGYRLIPWSVLTLACILFLYFLGKKTDLLRDRAPVLWKQEKPYSLSAVQAAWWFIVILISFIFIWLVTDQYDFSSTALILLSIGLGTALASTVIDANKKGETKGPEVKSSELNGLLSQKDKLETELTNLEARIQAKNNGTTQADFDKKKGDYDALIADIDNKFPSAIGPKHEKFYTDILSDAGGVSFHRFQMLAWTIVLSILFIYAVLNKLAMPDFSTTLLSLMGISAGTYIGFKIPETNSVTSQPTEPGGDSAEDPAKTKDVKPANEG